eukprot:scaffold136661_cov20-Tisochrysis_lutea.AAC.5
MRCVSCCRGAKGPPSLRVGFTGARFLACNVAPPVRRISCCCRAMGLPSLRVGQANLSGWEGMQLQWLVFGKGAPLDVQFGQGLLAAAF